MNREGKGPNTKDTTGGIPLHFTSNSSLNKINNSSVSNSNRSLSRGRSRRRANIPDSNKLLQVREPFNNNTSNSKILHSKKSFSSSSVYEPGSVISSNINKKGKSLSTNALSTSSSNPNLAGMQRRRSMRHRSQASTYLALRSRSPSP
jgi:hypothetical protein